MIKAKVIKRRFKSYDDTFKSGEEVRLLFTHPKLGYRWFRQGEDYNSSRGLNAMDLYVEVNMTEDEFSMEAMLNPTFQALILEGRVTRSDPL